MKQKKLGILTLSLVLAPVVLALLLSTFQNCAGPNQIDPRDLSSKVQTRGTTPNSVFITTLFQGLLGATPSTNDFNTYDAAIQGGAGCTAVANDVLGRSDHTTYESSRTTDQVIADLYLGLLNVTLQAGDPRTKAGEVSISGTGNSTSLANFIIGSPQFVTYCSQFAAIGP